MLSPALTRLWVKINDQRSADFNPDLQRHAENDLLFIDVGDSTQLEVTHSEYDRVAFPFEARYNLHFRRYDRTHGLESELWLADVAEADAAIVMIKYHLDFWLQELRAQAERDGSAT